MILPPLALPTFLAVAATGAPGGSAADHSVRVFLMQIVALLVVGRLAGEVMQRLRQPAVMGQLIAGILLGPSVLGTLWPAGQHALFPDVAAQKKMLDAIAQFGVLLLLLLTGMETDLRLVNRVRRTAVIASLAGIVLPFACGFALGEFLPAAMLPDPNRRLLTSLFLATALSISSVKIVATVIREVDFMRRNIGQVILAAAILDDTVAWVIIALVGGLASTGGLNVVGLGTSVLGTAAFLVLSFTVGRRVVPRLIRWANDHLTIEFPVITLILVFMGLMALATDLIGVHTVLGAFVAGILVGQSPILTRHIDEQFRGLIVALFMPVFFGVAGLSINLTILADPRMLGLAVGLVAIASFGKLVGCYAGGRLGGIAHRESTALAIAMNARGSTEIIVASIGLGLGVLTRDLFTLVVIMAIVTTLFTPPLLRWALTRIPPTGEEKARLDREAKEEDEFVPHLERLLIGADASADGRLAARLAGWLVGARQITATVLDLEPHRAPGHPAPLPAAPATVVQSAVEQGVRQAQATATTLAEAAAATAKADDGPEDEGAATLSNLVAAGPTPEPEPAANLILQLSRPAAAGTSTASAAAGRGDARAPDAAGTVLTEAKKGYDMIFLGLGRPVEAPEAPGEGNPDEDEAHHGTFRRQLEAVLREFDGPTAIAVARGEPLPADPLPAGLLNVLVPTTGTDYSRRAAEVAVAIAKAAGGQVTALHVARPPDDNDLRRHSPERRLRTGRALVALVGEVETLGRREGVPVTARVITRRGQDDAILRQVERGGHNLVVLGVKARPSGERLFFGHSTTALIEQIPCALLVVKS